MSKAFDSLHFPLLIAKLRTYGFSDEALGFMRSYFCERKCRARIDPETTSEWYEATRVTRYALSIAKRVPPTKNYYVGLICILCGIVDYRKLQEMVTVMYKVKNNLSTLYIADLFKLNNSGYHLRNSDFILLYTSI